MYSNFYCFSNSIIFIWSIFRKCSKNIKTAEWFNNSLFCDSDEYYNWLHDENNYTIIQHPKTGYFVYADIKNDSLIPTEYLVGISNPNLCDLKKGCNISANKKLSIRQEYLTRETASIKHLDKIAKSNNPLSIGTINNIAVFVRFSDENEFDQDISYYEDVFNKKLLLL